MFELIGRLLGLGADAPDDPDASPSRFGDRGTDRSAGATGPLVLLVETGPKKIQVIKALREATGAGLAVAKAWADAPPVEVRTRDELAAETLIATIVDAGGFAEPIHAPLPGPPPVPAMSVDEPPAPVDASAMFSVAVELGRAQKIPAIKVVREHTGLGLRESKAHVDDAEHRRTQIGPYPRDQALALMMGLNEIGAIAELDD